LHELNATTTRNWMAVASRAPNAEAFTEHAVELSSESGETSLRLPSNWILSQKGSYKGKGGLNATARDMAEGTLKKIERGQMPSAKEIANAAVLRGADPEYGAKWVTSRMLGTVDSVWGSVPPEEWQEMIEFLDPETGRFFDGNYDKASGEKTYEKLLANLFYSATEGTEAEEM